MSDETTIPTTPAPTPAITTTFSPEMAPPTTAPPACPPWQVRWKRPQWDHVVVGMEDVVADDDSDPEKERDDVDVNQDNGSGDADNIDDDEYDNVDDFANLDWNPVSCSSVVLTRAEARMAILELHRHNQLLLVAPSNKKQKRQQQQQQQQQQQHEKKNYSQQQQQHDNTTATVNNGISGTTENEPQHNVKNQQQIINSGTNEVIVQDSQSLGQKQQFQLQGTPRNRNTKHTNQQQNQQQQQQHVTPTKNNKSKSKCAPNNSNNNATPHPIPKSLTSPSTWFNNTSTTNNNNNNASTKLFKTTGANKRNVRSTTTTTAASNSNGTTIETATATPFKVGASSSSPTSPSTFSTFSNFVSPRSIIKNENQHDGRIKQQKRQGYGTGTCDEDGNENNLNNEEEDDDGHFSSPPTIDTSTASSLLWEDMTLTSVSEEDAAAFRMYGSKKQRGGSGAVVNVVDSNSIGGGGGRKVVSTSIPAAAEGGDRGVGGGSNGRGGGRGVGERVKFGGDASFSNGGGGGGKYYYDRHGNVRLSDWDGFDNVVLTVTVFATATADVSAGSSSSAMENNRRPTSGDVVVMELLSTKNPSTEEDIGGVTSAAATWGKHDTQHHSGKSKTSSTSSPQPPPPQPSSKGGSTTTSGTEEDSSYQIQQQQQRQCGRFINDVEEEEIPSNHTRIIARRILRWPTSVLPQKKSRSNPASSCYSQCAGCPSFVALGRTSKWEERKQRDENVNDGKTSLHPSVHEKQRRSKVAKHHREEEIDEQEGNGHGKLESDDDDDDDNHGEVIEDESDNENIKGRGNNKHHQSSKKTSSWFDQFFDQEERAADALDAVRSLNFLFGGDAAMFGDEKKMESKSTGGASSNSAQEGKGGNNTTNHSSGRRKKLSQPLSLCFVTNDGRVHFFHALRVFLSRKSHKVIKAHSRDSFSASFAAFLMGTELHAKVCEDVIPLSHPRASVRLSQMSQLGPKSVKTEEGDCDEDCSIHDDPLIWRNLLLRHKKDNIEGSPQTTHDEQDPSTKSNWSQLSTFDASIDSSTLDFRTLPRSNFITGTCITSDTSNSYLAICGKGLRRLVHHDKNNPHQFSLGGFVTFVSLRYCSEARTIYLPFSPESIHPVYWHGMHFVIMLGEEGSPTAHRDFSGMDSRGDSVLWGDERVLVERSNHREATGNGRRPYAMALRVDCKNYGIGDMPSALPVDTNAENAQSAIKNSFRSSTIRNSIRPTDQNGGDSSNVDSIFMSKFERPQEDLAAPSNQLPPKETLEPSMSSLYPSRFQSVRIHLPSVCESLGLFSYLFPQNHNQLRLGSIHSKAIAVSSVPSSPPGIVMSFQHLNLQDRVTPNVVFVNLMLESFWSNSDGAVTRVEDTKSSIALSSVVRSGHRLVLNLDLGEFPITKDDGGAKTESLADKRRSLSNFWCTSGQGWSLIGEQKPEGKTFFISWDGATEAEGPFAFQLRQKKTNVMHRKNNGVCLASGVMPLMSYVSYTEKFVNNQTMSRETRANGGTLPFAKPYSLPFFIQNEEGGFPADYAMTLSCSATLKESIKSAVEIEGGIDDMLLKGLESISRPPMDDQVKIIQSGRPNRSRSLAMSHAEKSKRLLRHCSSWTQLDDTRANRGIVNGQVIVATLRMGTSTKSLTLRSNIVANPIATPFHQVLAWLCQQNDYFTAASVALSLLGDIDAVYELRGIPKTSEGELISHRGLLDGITPLVNKSAQDQISGSHLHTLTSLADMTVGCLIKGGTSMASTLDGFLTRDSYYDAPRACLMLVGIMAAVISEEPSSDLTFNRDQNIVKMLASIESPREDVLWPARCLLKMAVVRNCLPSVLLMLNATIPNELRWRAPKSRGLATSPRPSLGLCLSLVEMILETANEATRYFLNLKDEESGLSYWYSIEDDTRLALSLLSIHGKNVMILEPEVRIWALEKLKEEIESPVKYNGSNSTLPSEWLKEIITGTFCNAECDIGMGLDARIARKSVAEFQFSKDENSVCYRQDMLCVQDLVVPHKLSGGLDFDLLIPALLILVRRDENWREGTSISTQILLNVVCDMAGRKTDVEPKFMFDGATVMRQCALADNFQATSFLVGGKNGLILECADVVISSLGVTMKVAEVALFAGSVVEMEKIVTQSYHEFPIQEKTEFIPNESHHHLLWLLQQHVLNVRTYGEFSPTSNNRGKINPVFAGRVCFRAWICLTHPSLQKISAKWLEGWLRRNLELVCGKSTKRLACAALVRVLLWTVEASELDLSDGDDDPLLAALVGFDGRFMAELAQACCGLIESIPPHLAEEIMSGLGGSNLFSFETGLLNAV